MLLTPPILKRFALLLIFGFVSACSQPSLIENRDNIDTPGAGIAGQVTNRNGDPASGAYVYAYRNLRGNLRGPADFEAQVRKDSSYFLDLVEGDYYLVARMRQSGADAGPPKAGDAWALPAKNPVSVKPGEITTINFILQGIAQPMLMREGTLTSGDTGFTGLLVDSNDKPLTGAFAIAYPDADYQRMPEATSATVTVNSSYRWGEGRDIQVAKSSIGTKGPRVTTHISLAGRYIILVRFSNTVSVS